MFTVTASVDFIPSDNDDKFQYAPSEVFELLETVYSPLLFATVAPLPKFVGIPVTE